MHTLARPWARGQGYKDRKAQSYSSKSFSKHWESGTVKSKNVQKFTELTTGWAQCRLSVYTEWKTMEMNHRFSWPYLIWEQGILSLNFGNLGGVTEPGRWLFKLLFRVHVLLSREWLLWFEAFIRASSPTGCRHFRRGRAVYCVLHHWRSQWRGFRIRVTFSCWVWAGLSHLLYLCVFGS